MIFKNFRKLSIQVQYLGNFIYQGEKWSEKSTLMKMITGILLPNVGSFEKINGIEYVIFTNNISA